MTPPALTFLGAAGTVTGSKHLLEADGRRILVDCGLFQGLKELRLRNWAPLPVDPGTIDALILTHAHLDHCGYLPRLVAAGFRDRVFCTPATKELCSLVLPDSAHLQEEDAREANRHGFTKHQPALPLYTSIDAARALSLLQPVGYDRPVPLWGQTPTVEFINAGHLLGSAYARVRLDGKTILFGGDLGRYGRPVLPDPSPVAEADILLVESTYGDRLHEADDRGDRLASIVTETADRGGKLIIPSFAIGRVEEILYWLKRLEDEKRIPVLPVYVDSPMAIGALQFYSSRLNELDAEFSRLSDTVLFVGYQAAGTRGRLLTDGAKEIKLLGRLYAVAAHVERIDSMSAHADSAEIMRWLSGFSRAPRMTYLVHGEPAAAQALAARITAERHWPVHIAAHLERVELPG